MDLLGAMRTFRRVVELDSFSKAAADLGQSTAAVSKQVRQLEERLGALLLLRTTRRMSLSDAGRRYYAECCRLLDELEALERSTAQGAEEVSGSLRINAPLSFSHKVLSPLLARFMARYPRLNIELTLDDRLLDVVAEGFDVSLRIRAELVDSSLVARRLGETAQVLCASPAYLAQQGTPAQLEDLRQHACLAYRLADHPGQWQLLGPQGEVSIQLPARFSADNSLILCDLLLAGTGIGALPSFIAQPLLDSGQLQRVLPDYQFAKRSIYALYSSSRHVPRKVRAFVEFLAEALAACNQGSPGAI